MWRRLLGAVVLLDLLLRFPDLEAHYSDLGVLPRALFVDDLGGASPWLRAFRTSGQYLWSTLFLSGSKEWAWGTLAGGAVGALLLMAGRVPRLASCITWIFLTSIQARNPLINNGGDTLLRLMLFWSVLQPLARSRPNPSSIYGKIASWGLLCQIAVVYGVTAWLKFGEAWVYRGYAIQDALRLQAFARPFAGWLLHYPAVLPLLTRLTWCVEAVIPILVCLGGARPSMRITAFLLILGLQLGIGCLLDVGLFQGIAIIAALPILPQSLWDAWEEKGPWPRLFFPTSAPRDLQVGVPVRPSHRWTLQRGPAVSWRPPAALTLMVPTMAWLLVMTRQVDAVYPRQRWIPRPLMIAGEILRVDQYWGMFAPSPPRSEQGTFSFVGDPPHDAGIAFESNGTSSEPLSRAFRSDRWRKLYLNLTHEEFKVLRPALRGYLYRGRPQGDLIFTRADGSVVSLTGQ